MRLFLTALINGTILGGSIKREHHLLSIRMRDLLSTLNEKYGIDKQYLKAYRQNLLKIIEADEDYQQKCEAHDKKIELSSETTRKVHDVLVKNDHVFTDILLKIYG